jgi:hypothetical protein
MDDSVGALEPHTAGATPFHLLTARQRVPHRAGEAVLLSALRDSLQLNFGDAALGAALASLQGAPLSRTHTFAGKPRSRAPSSHRCFSRRTRRTRRQ